ncbi:MAG: 4Fe-4S dicluster domain-containing protein [Deltaproteobacteria bacterium]|nr:4Fe-4S dicluster domain-containing protein [Deltaproteobacteria bacterium]
MEIEFEASKKDLWKEIYDNENLHHCFNCGTCISGCPASNGDPPLLVRNLARMVILGLEEELLEEDSPWACVSCSKCEEMCPMDVKPFELILAIRKWQSYNDVTYVPTAIVEIYKRGYTQAVGVNTEVRESLGLPDLPTITKNPEMLAQFQEMLMKTPVISDNDYMFKGK